MKVKKSTVRGKWTEVKSDLQKAWGKLTDDELEKTKGDIKAISGLIQKKYGVSMESSSSKLAEIFKRFDTKSESIVERVKA